jgi:5-carboxymethyl-2-hydroxymuconate isomerase
VPHIIIECSANVAERRDLQRLVDAVHAAALDHGLPALDALRTRVTVRSPYRIADGHPDNAFVAITARVAPGRSAETKRSFMEAVLDTAEKELTLPDDSLTIAYSIEVQEIDPDSRINRNYVRARMEAED